MHRLLFSIAALTLTGALVAGCGSSSKSSSSASTTSSPAPTPATGGKAAAPGASVMMKNIKFVPMKITVKAGQPINWKNNDAVAHTVTATSGAKFDSGTVNAGGTFKFTPTKAGTIQYMCTIHPNQKGTITVTG